MNGLDVLLPGPKGERDGWRWGAVTQVSPLQVTLEHDDDPLTVTLSPMTAGLAVSDRVLVLRHGTKATVWGQAAPPVDDTGWVTITTAPGFTGTNAQSRVKGGILYLRGSISGSFTANATTTIGTTASGHAPSYASGAGMATTGGATGWGQILTNNTIYVRAPSTATHNFYLGALSGHPVD